MSSTKQNINYDIISIDMLIFELERIEWDLSVMRISYKLTKRTIKTKKIEKFSKKEKYQRLFAIN